MISKSFYIQGCFVLLLSVKCLSERIVDLTWEFDEKTIFWKKNKTFEYENVIESNKNGYWYASKEFRTAEHGGSHLDAPYHFDENGWKVADIPIERFFPNAYLLDFSEEAAATGPDYTPNPETFTQKLNALGPLANNSVLLIKFGWSKYWPERKKYMGEDGSGLKHSPGLDNLTAIIIAKDDNIVGVGVDTSSVDFGASSTLAAHRILLGKSKYFMENVKITEQLPDAKFKLVVAPMKLTTGTGAPVRIFAII